MTTITETPSTETIWNLDQTIEHERDLAALIAQVAAMPDDKGARMAEDFLCTHNLTYTPVKAHNDGERMWRIGLPSETGRKMRWGMSLMLVQHAERGYLDDVYVHVSKLRRLVQPKYAALRGRFPIIGTVSKTVSGVDNGIYCLPNRSALERYTKRV